MTRSAVIIVTVASMGLTAIAATEMPTAVEITAIIEQLVSPNKVPIAFPYDKNAGPEAVYPPGYDRKAQDVVLAALFRLRNLGPIAFPSLFPYMNDQRYSFTADAGEAEWNWRVSDACRDVIQSQVQAFCSHYHLAYGEGTSGRRSRRPNYFVGQGLNDLSKAQVWWEARKHKSLREFQVEALEWTIAEEAKSPEDFSDEERSYLQATLAELRAANEPLKPYTLWSK